MQSMSDDELDKLFKEAAEGFNAPHDSSAWQDMLMRLDNRPVTSGFWNWKTISTVALIGLTGVGLIWYATQNNSGEPMTRNVMPPPNNIEMGNKGNQPSGEDGAVLSIENSATDFAPKEATHENSAALANNPNLRRTINEKLPVKNKTEIVDEHNKQTNQIVRPIEIIADGNNSLVSGLAPLGGSVVTSNSADAVQADRTVMPAQVFSDVSTDSLSLDSVTNNVQQKAPKDSAQVVINKEEQKDDQEEKGSSFNIKLTVAPDFTSVNYYTPDKSGFNYGLLMGYSFNNRWSVYSGAIYSKKIYSSDEIEEPYTTSGGYDYEVTELTGDCRVIDIPINVYYAFFPERSFSIKAGLGFTSYIMLQEDYTFYVDNPYGTDEYHQYVENENNEWFKMLNISVMFQRKLSSRFYLELEPFLKAPLTGVGEGEVSLVSMGAFFSLRFDIPIHKP